MTTPWRTCKTHGDEDPNVYGCAECVRQLRDELASARHMMEDCTGDDAYERVTLWLEQHPEPPTP